MNFANHKKISLIKTNLCFNSFYSLWVFTDLCFEVSNIIISSRVYPLPIMKLNEHCILTNSATCRWNCWIQFPVTLRSRPIKLQRTSTWWPKKSACCRQKWTSTGRRKPRFLSTFWNGWKTSKTENTSSSPVGCCGCCCIFSCTFQLVNCAVSTVELYKFFWGFKVKFCLNFQG